MSISSSNSDYFELLSEHLKAIYCIDFDDTGYTKEEWLAQFGGLELDDAIEEYAQKYALTPLNELTTPIHHNSAARRCRYG